MQKTSPPNPLKWGYNEEHEKTGYQRGLCSMNIQKNLSNKRVVL